MISSIAFIVLSYPIMTLLSFGGVVLASAVLIVSLMFFAMNDAVFPSFFTELFGTRSRYLGFALPFNVGAMLFGGVAPLIGTWLIATTGNPQLTGILPDGYRSPLTGWTPHERRNRTQTTRRRAS